MLRRAERRRAEVDKGTDETEFGSGIRKELRSLGIIAVKMCKLPGQRCRRRGRQDLAGPAEAGGDICVVVSV